MKDNKEIVLAAVKERGNALEYAHKDLRKDPELIKLSKKR